MREKTTEVERVPPSSVFDGFCHRPFSEDLDGWMLEQKEETSLVRFAYGIIDAHNEINELRRENWRLQKRLDQESILNTRRDQC